MLGMVKVERRVEGYVGLAKTDMVKPGFLLKLAESNELSLPWAKA